MPIPDFQTLMLPLLRVLADGKNHTTKKAEEELAKMFSLSAEELKELLPSKRQTVFANRVAWAKAHLKMAGILENVSRGVFRLTPRGIEVLQAPPERINIAFLKQFPEYQPSGSGENGKSASPVKAALGQDISQTPEEIIAPAYAIIRKALADELLAKVKSCSPQFFENLVVDLLVKMGYGGSRYDAGEALGKSGDEGIDGIIKEDRLGLDVIYIQAKRWEGSVGRPEIQRFVGALAGKGAKKGVFITTSRFTPDAAAYMPHETRVVLIDGSRLAELMIDFNLGVSVEQVFEIKKMDTDYFETGI